MEKKKKKRDARNKSLMNFNIEGKQLRNKGEMSISLKPPMGMTLEEAESVPGVGGLGKTKPAWQ